MENSKPSFAATPNSRFGGDTKSRVRRFAFTDEGGPAACLGVPSSIYRFTATPQSLTLEAVSDECPGRVNFFEGGWSLPPRARGVGGNRGTFAPSFRAEIDRIVAEVGG